MGLTPTRTHTAAGPSAPPLLFTLPSPCQLVTGPKAHLLRPPMRSATVDKVTLSCSFSAFKSSVSLLWACWAVDQHCCSAPKRSLQPVHRSYLDDAALKCRHWRQNTT